MATDATDKLLVASVLERGKRDVDGDTVQPEQEDEIGAPRNFGVAGELGVQVTVEESQKQPWQEPPAKLEEDEDDKPSTQAELEAMAQDMVGIDDPVRMYLKEIGKVPLLNAEEEVVFAKAIELGEQIVEETGVDVAPLVVSDGTAAAVVPDGDGALAVDRFVDAAEAYEKVEPPDEERMEPEEMSTFAIAARRLSAIRESEKAERAE